jgi:ribonuclease P protein component
LTHTPTALWRLSKKEEFDRVISSGKKVSQFGITAWILPAKRARLGFAVSKNYGPAVRRNQFKRRARAAFQNAGSLLPPVDIVLSAASTKGWIEYGQIEAFMTTNIMKSQDDIEDTTH